MATASMPTGNIHVISSGMSAPRPKARAPPIPVSTVSPTVVISRMPCSLSSCAASGSWAINCSAT